MTPSRTTRRIATAAAIAAFACVALQGSSHREAPGITKTPKVDATDFYMFRSYDPGRAEFVTLIANYLPLPDPTYLRWRMYTAYGNEDAVPPVEDVVRFARWRRETMGL